MLFNYNSGIKEIFLRKGAYLPGQIAKSGWKLVESVNSLNTNPAIEFGTVLKRQIEPTTKIPYVTQIEEDDEPSDFYGVAVKDVTSEISVDLASTNARIIKNYLNGVAISVMREGYICVPVQNGTPITGEQVYVRIMPSMTNPSLPIGGIEALASQGTIAWKNVFFESGPYFPLEGNNISTSADTPTSQCATIKVAISDYNKAVKITSAPTATAITYGTTLGDIVLNGGEAKDGENVIGGKFVMNSPSYIPPVGTETYTATFIPNDLMTYEKVTNVEVVITVNPATPTIITLPRTSRDLYYGDRLDTIALIGGKANTEGAFEWDEPNTAPQASGNQKVIFYPIDTRDYTDLNDIDVMVTVVKVPTEATVIPTASSVNSGDQLSASTISGGTVVDKRDKALVIQGTWNWDISSLTVSQTSAYGATFTPTNAAKYEPVHENIVVTVN